MSFGLAGKRVVLTGAGGGLGREMLALLQAEGARVVACEREGVAVAADEIERFDLTDAAATEAAAGRIAARGAPDALISNAGGSRIESLEATDTEGLIAELTLNFTGAAVFSRALLPSMRGRPGGAAMVFVASVNALAHFGNPAYSAAKAGLIAWSRAVAVEEGGNGLRSNVVAPGSIRTPAWDERKARQPDVFDRVARLYPMRRLVEPAEVARAAMFLASPLASGISGAVLPVDAGLTAGMVPFIEAIGN